MSKFVIRLVPRILEKLAGDDDLMTSHQPKPLGLFNLPKPKAQGLLSTHAWEIFDTKDGKCF